MAWGHTCKCLRLNFSRWKGRARVYPGRSHHNMRKIDSLCAVQCTNSDTNRGMRAVLAVSQNSTTPKGMTLPRKASWQWVKERCAHYLDWRRANDLVNMCCQLTLLANWLSKTASLVWAFCRSLTTISDLDLYTSRAVWYHWKWYDMMCLQVASVQGNCTDKASVDVWSNEWETTVCRWSSVLSWW